MDTRVMKQNEPTTDPFELAIRWIENEVHTNGVFEIRQELGTHYDHKTGITRQVPTGRFGGFTVSSQHVGNAYNLLQLVMKMRGDYDNLSTTKAKEQLEKFRKRLLRRK